MIENLLKKLGPADLVELGGYLEIYFKNEWGTFDSGFFCGSKGKVMLDVTEVKEVRLNFDLKCESVETPEPEEVEEVEEEEIEEVIEEVVEEVLSSEGVNPEDSLEGADVDQVETDIDDVTSNDVDAASEDSDSN